jgi:GT2 family glycosyltransferase
MSLVVMSRDPLRLEPGTVAAVLDRPIPRYAAPAVERHPVATLITVCFNNLVFTRMAIESILANCDSPSYELLIVDNASTDGTAGYLRGLAAHYPQVRVLWNEENRGFAAANNRALEHARGEFIVLLNNDTIVPQGWLPALLQHARAAEVGLAGPSTNRIGNEAEIEVDYRTYAEFERFAAAAMRAGPRRAFDIRTAAMFCVALRRSTFERIGLLDEQFGPGMFEDDDYSMRVREAGLRVVCTDDVFVHHFGKATFGDLAAAGSYGRLFHENRRRWEDKWRRPWQPYERRTRTSYHDLVHRIRAAADRVLPTDCQVLIAAHGDPNLLKLYGRQCSHFPQQPDGSYAGHHPADSAAAAAELQGLCDRGATYFILPRTMRWWLEYYPGFRSYLEDGWTIAWHDGDCTIYQSRIEPAAAQLAAASVTGRDK